MAPPNSAREQRRFFSVEEANRTLPLVRQIVADIVGQWNVVSELKQRLSILRRRDVKRGPGDPYTEEVAQSVAELEAEESKLQRYTEELGQLGVELKGENGLCDFPSLRDGREVCLCWRLGEPAVQHWHEVNAGFAGRQPLEAIAPEPAGNVGR